MQLAIAAEDRNARRHISDSDRMPAPVAWREAQAAIGGLALPGDERDAATRGWRLRALFGEPANPSPAVHAVANRLAACDGMAAGR